MAEAAALLRTFRIDSNDEPGSHFFEVPETERPEGATTQWLSFRFRCEGLTRHSPGSHFAVILLAHLVRDEAGAPLALSGRGIALGNTIEAFAAPTNLHACGHPDYGGSRGLVLESFWPGGNFLFREACVLDTPLEDGRDYVLHVHARADGWFAAWVDAEASTCERAGKVACVRDAEAHPVIPATGILIALARGANESGPWSVTFDRIGFGWF